MRLGDVLGVGATLASEFEGSSQSMGGGLELGRLGGSVTLRGFGLVGLDLVLDEVEDFEVGFFQQVFVLLELFVQFLLLGTQDADLLLETPDDLLVCFRLHRQGDFQGFLLLFRRQRSFPILSLFLCVVTFDLLPLFVIVLLQPYIPKELPVFCLFSSSHLTLKVS